MNVTRPIRTGQVNTLKFILRNPAHIVTAAGPWTINVTRWVYYPVTVALEVEYAASFALSNASWVMRPANCSNIRECNASAATYHNCSASACLRGCFHSDPRPPAPVPPEVYWVNETVIPTSAMTIAPDPIAHLPASQAGDTLPLNVRAPALVIRLIRQTHAYPAISNMLIFTIASNVPLSQNNQDCLVVHGLTGATAQTGPIKLWPSPSPHNETLGHQLFAADSYPSSVGTGVWRKDDVFQDTIAPSLRLIVQQNRNIEVGTTYSLEVYITNPASAQTSPNIWILQRGVYSLMPPVTADKSSGMLVNEHQIVVGSVAPLEISPVHWIYRQGAQSTMYPGVRTTVTISLICSVRLEQGMCITVAGFRNARPYIPQILSIGTRARLLFIGT